MDIALPPPPRPRWKHAWTGAAVLLPLAVYAAVSWSPRTAPARADIRFATVESGGPAFNVPGYGVLAPRRQKLVTAPVGGRVDEIAVQPGMALEPGDLIARLADPAVARAVQAAEQAVRAAGIDVDEAALGGELDAVNARAALADLATQLAMARKEHAAMAELVRRGVVSRLEASRQEARIEALQSQIQAQRERAAVTQKINASRIALKRAALERAAEALALARANQESLSVRADIRASVQEVGVSLGQAVAAGETLAQVASSDELIASLRIPQHRAGAVATGAAATLTVQGRALAAQVLRVDPKVADGMVRVDVLPAGALPAGSRSGQAVTGEIRAAADAGSLYIQGGQHLLAGQRAEVFVLREPGQLVRASVQLGAQTGDYIEVLAGLRAGDRVALSLDPAGHDQSTITLTEP
jgi:HlyD family secretion protein